MRESLGTLPGSISSVTSPPIVASIPSGPIGVLVPDSFLTFFTGECEVERLLGVRLWSCCGWEGE